jgi:class 3 adenylate cyclase
MAPGPRSGFTLRFSLASAFIILVVGTTLLVAMLSALYTGSLIKESIRDRLHDIVALGTQLIDAEVHDAIQAPGDEAGADFARVLAALNKIRQVNDDVKYVYTLRKNAAGQIVFVVDSDPDLESRAAIAYEMTAASAVVESVFASASTVQVESDYNSDEWGSFISGYGSFYHADGSLAGVLGVDISAHTVEQYLANSFIIILVVSLLASVLTLLLSLLVASKITQPIVAITGEMLEIQSFNLLEGDFKSSRIREIQKMIVTLGNMKRSLRSFKKYVPSTLVANLVRSGQEAVLGAEKKDVSIFFSDIENFTGISEQLAPDVLAKVLGDYLAALTGAIMASGGIVDKYIGDAIMALWNVPEPLADHTLQACRAALACQKVNASFNADLVRQNLPPFNTRIGINTGEAIVGNMGYEERLSYTAIGDNCNLASRLEGLNKYYHTTILVSGAVYEIVKDAMLGRLVDLVAVKGKSKGIRLYELQGELPSVSPELIERTLQHNQAMELYLGRRWSEALGIFERLALGGGDYVLELLIGRCREFVANPPGVDWTGLIAIREK